MDYNKIAREVLKNVGGEDNITSAAHCVTRLRLVLKDTSKYDKVALENIEGAKGVFFNSGQLQVIFGTGLVDRVYAAFVEEADIKESSLDDVKTEGRKNTGKLQEMFKAFSDIFVDLIPGIVGCAMILGLRAILITGGLFGLEATLADTYKWASDLSAFLNVIATGLKFLPVFVMYSATKRFGGNPVLGIIIGLVLVHPELGNRFDYLQGKLTDVTYWNFIGINVPAVAFQGGVFPAILTALFLAKFEKFLTKRVPQILSFILVPTLTIIVSAGALFLVFGPLGDVIATGLGFIIELLYMKSGVFGAFIFAAVLQPLVITGTHHAIGSIEAQLIASTGFNYIQPLWAVSITAQGAACVGMFLLAKKKSKRREIAEYSDEVDSGFDFYAPQAFYGKNNVAMMVAWCGCGEQDLPSDKDMWKHGLTMPYELKLRQNRLMHFVVPELLEHFKQKQPFHNEKVTTESNTYHLTFEVSAQQDEMSIQFGYSKDYFKLQFDFKQNEISVDRSHLNLSVDITNGEIRKTKGLNKNSYQVDVFVDNSFVEIFINEGEKSFVFRTFNMTSQHNDIIFDWEAMGEIAYYL